MGNPTRRPKLSELASRMGSDPPPPAAPPLAPAAPPSKRRPRSITVLVDRELYNWVFQLVKVTWAEEREGSLTISDIVRALLEQLERDPQLRQRIHDVVVGPS